MLAEDFLESVRRAASRETPSGQLVDGYRIALGVDEPELEAERPVHRCLGDPDPGCGQPVVQTLRVVRRQPERHAPAETRGGVEVDEGLPYPPPS